MFCILYFFSIIYLIMFNIFRVMMIWDINLCFCRFIWSRDEECWGCVWRLGMWVKEICCRKGDERWVGGVVVVGVDVGEKFFLGLFMGKSGLEMGM